MGIVLPHGETKPLLQYARWAGCMGPLNVWQLEANGLPFFTRFVFEAYTRAYTRLHGWQPTEADYEALLEEDQRYFNQSYYWFFYCIDEVVGSLKLTHWHPGMELSMQKHFGIDPMRLSSRPLWHCGRLATRWHKEMKIDKVRLLPLLCQWAVGFVAAYGGVMLAEVDRGVLRLLVRMGLRVQPLAAPAYVVGSLTIPILIDYTDLRQWVEKQTLNHAL